MSNQSRRDFTRKAALGAGVLSTGISSFGKEKTNNPLVLKNDERAQLFNMSGYAAPSMEVVRVGFIGLGQRGPGAVERMAQIKEVEIVGLCDLFPERVAKAQETLAKAGLPKAKDYSGSEDAWKKMCERKDIDLIYICTPWSLHTPMALFAMENDKHVGVEVPAALTVGDAWKLVETSERTKKHCMMLENCCYDFFELLTISMAHQGFFGDIVHGEGGYIHNLLEKNFDKDSYVDMWRLKDNMVSGNLYPTHGLGPICQAMNVNRGDRFDYLTSMSSNDFQMAQMAEDLAAKDDFYAPFKGKNYRGNMNTSIIRTQKGRTIMVQHDVTSTRPYSRIHIISGTKGIAQKWPEPGRISTGHEWMTEQEMKPLWDKYTPEIVKRVGEIAKKVGGHGGMDFIMDWRLIDNLRYGLPLDQDVYDAAAWSVVTPLSIWSVANRSNSIDIPDFTCGAWEKNTPINLTLDKGGDTSVREVDIDSGKQLKVH